MEGGVRGRREGGMEGEGRGRRDGLRGRECWASSPCLRCCSLRRSRHVSPWLCPCCQLVFACPCCHALIPCPRCVVVLYCGRASFFCMVVMVPSVSEQGGTSLGWGGAHRGVVSLFGCHIATATWHLVSVSRRWWFSWCWQPLLCMWASVRARFGVFVVVWVVWFVCGWSGVFVDLGHLTPLYRRP